MLRTIKSLKIANIMIILFELLVSSIIAYFIYETLSINRQINTQEIIRHKMTLVANELHISSDELTRMARTYTVTKDKQYKETYYRILDIRNGKVTRPNDLSGIYWDLEQSDRNKKEGSEKIAFQKIIQELPFTKEEKTKLTESEKNSNQLVHMEEKAFKALEDDSKKRQLHAINLLHSKAYHQEKAKIMKPIDEFNTMFLVRMNALIGSLQQKLKYNLIGITVLFIILFVGNIFIYFYLNKKEDRDKEQIDFALKYAKAKSLFLANMSHEIRTPLNAILGFINLLKKEVNSSKGEEYLQVIQKSSKGLLKIIEDILDLSKIESDKLAIDPIDFNLDYELNIVIELFKARASEKNVTICSDIDDKVPQTLHADPLRLKQVLINLIGNALKFSSPGQTITISIKYRNEMLSISVKDQGKGIEKDKQKQIFEAFKQEDNSTTRLYGGTGLGLTISSQLISLMGGELKVDSILGKGSTFSFSIPAPVGTNPIMEEEDTVIPFDQKHILVVEDNKSNQLLMSIILQELNLTYTIANDGREAVELFKNHHFDAVLMDENMPHMSGIEATQAILAYEKEKNLNHTPIIALTANAIKGSREKFLNAGMDEFLTKPIDMQILSKTLHQFLRTKSVSSA